jgi:hypothetical protein
LNDAKQHGNEVKSLVMTADELIRILRQGEGPDEEFRRDFPKVDFLEREFGIVT